MSVRPSRFGSLAQAVKERAAAVADAPAAPPAQAATTIPTGAGLHKPAVALGTMAEGLRERIARLEAELAQASGQNATLERELAEARDAAGRAGAAVEEFLFLAPQTIRDTLPRDRLPGAFEGKEFEDLVDDIRANGQNDAVTVRPSADGVYEVAAGRRRLEACRRLSRPVLARVRPLDDAAMLRVQFSENERREDISALERGRWFAAVKSRLDLPAKDIAAQFGIDPSTLSLYLRLSRFPTGIVERLREPRRLSVLRARRVMEMLESDPDALDRILDALDAQARGLADTGGPDPDGQIELLLQAAEGRGGQRGPSGARAPVPDRRHVVHNGRRVGTLTRNGGQWVFRFATSLDDAVIQAMAERFGDLAAEVEAKARGPSAGSC
jgi:ParB family transcriptional regulator, chromosome partitioning protein